MTQQVVLHHHASRKWAAAAAATDIQDKVKRYLEGVKAKNADKNQECLGPNNIVYDSIQQRYLKETTAINLMGGNAA
jgi:hypothetical protein